MVFVIFMCVCFCCLFLKKIVGVIGKVNVWVLFRCVVEIISFSLFKNLYGLMLGIKLKFKIDL